MAKLKYIWTPALDDALKQAYAKCPHRRATVAVDLMVSATGFPRHQVKGRAQKLGVTHCGRPWRMQELAFLREHAGRKSANWIAEKLHRSWNSVTAKMDQQRISRRMMVGWTREQTAAILGVHRDTVGLWVAQRELRLNDHNRIMKISVEEFFDRRLKWLDLRMVDQTWLHHHIQKLLGKRVAIRDRRAQYEMKKAKAA